MTTEEKNAAISLTIAALHAAGMPVRDAVDAVLGAGSYLKIAGLVYDELRAVATKSE